MAVRFGFIPLKQNERREMAKQEARMAVRFGFIPVRPGPLLSEEAFDQAVGSYILALERMGGERWSGETLENPAPLFYLMATGGTEGVLLDLRAERSKVVPDEPVFLLAHPTHNSLPASLEVLARLRQDGERGRILYLRGPDDEAGFGQIEAAVRDVAVRRALKQARIGLVGAPSDWLVASSPDPATVRGTWGPEVVPVAMDEIARALQAAPSETVDSILEPLIASAAEVREPSRAELEEVVRVYVALKQAVERHSLDAITVRCFDLVGDLRTTGCFGLAQLTDEGVVAACEGDLVSTVGMLWAYLLLGQIPWMANPAQLDEASDTLWLAHCTVPRRIVRDYGLRSHFESGLGVGIQGTLPNGPVTLLRIGGAAMDEIWLAEGELLRDGDAENLCRTQAEVRLARGRVRDLLHAPLGNHLVLVQGHHAGRLRAWWETMIAR
jgi:L-fucose isomerase-like protein